MVTTLTGQLEDHSRLFQEICRKGVPACWLLTSPDKDARAVQGWEAAVTGPGDVWRCCVCARVSTHSICVTVWDSGCLCGSFWCLLPLFSTLYIEAEVSQLNPELINEALTIQLLEDFLLCLPRAGIKVPPTPTQHVHGAGDLNSGPCTCTVSALLMRLLPNSLEKVLKRGQDTISFGP